MFIFSINLKWDVKLEFAYHRILKAVNSLSQNNQGKKGRQVHTWETQKNGLN